ncbi:hypothetical protein ACJIZ3_012984 [Penstemon smallii]|uniref:Vesicle transport protein n=1 Tax=Penstemon smallii TaxID=265156 RepID=A0ABD3UNL2_9LAMI
MPKWFSASFGDNENENSLQQTASSSSSLLSDWNSYTATRSFEESSSGSGTLAGVFDIESAVRSVNDTVSGTFNFFQSATSDIPSGKSLMYFGLLLTSGVFFKFAICFTIGCALIIGSFFRLRGQKNQFTHISSMERLPFTLGFLGSMVGTIYVSMVLHSYVLSVLFSGLQHTMLSLTFRVDLHAGLKFLSSSLTSSVLKCFGR